MKKNKKILVWLSGWVDSAVSAYLLKKAGYDVTAWFMINYLAPEWEYCPAKDDLKVAKEVAAFLEIPFFTFDYRDFYEEKVLNYMYGWYKKWITPNPDIMCNSEVKFKLFLEEALEHWFDGIAMGHYARIVKKVESRKLSSYPEQTSPQPSPKQTSPQHSPLWWEGVEQLNSPFPSKERGLGGEVFSLLKWIDNSKDQSYFLAGLNQFQLSKAIFPIWNMKKTEVRELAKKIWLPNALRKDSQWICFVWKVDMNKFLDKKIKPKKWLVKNTSGKILWEHKWVYYYTIGQRKWLDIWWQSEPIFIVKKDIEKNEIIVGNSKDLELYDNKLFIKNMHFLRPLPNLPLVGEGITNNLKIISFPLKAKAKIRYRQADQDCIVFAPSKKWENWKVEFTEKQRAIARGQICAIYLEDELVMSWVIN